MKENIARGIYNRIAQHLARLLPGAESVRVALHRSRGVRIGRDAWIGNDVILDTARPHLITIGDRVQLNMRVTVIAHFRETQGVTIGNDVFVGAGAMILPNVVVGDGAVITAGSVVTKSVPAMTVVQGNPAVPVARCGVPLKKGVSVREFSMRLRPVASMNKPPEGKAMQPARAADPQ